MAFPRGSALPVKEEVTRETVEYRRKQLLECARAVASLAQHREIQAQHVSQVKYDIEIRPVLSTVVRRWTTTVAPTYATRRALRAPRSDLHIEHVVPVRVLVDRMIMKPAECRQLLNRCVVLAWVSREQHRRLGGIFVHHEELYRQMLVSPLADLVTLGLGRYRRSRITLYELKQ